MSRPLSRLRAAACIIDVRRDGRALQLACVALEDRLEVLDVDTQGAWAGELRPDELQRVNAALDLDRRLQREREAARRGS